MPLTPSWAEQMPEVFGPGNCFHKQHIISADQFDPDSLGRLFQASQLMRKSGRAMFGSLAGRILITYFSQESTRTRMSFEASMLRLGGNNITTTNAEMTSSEVKGETLSDTMKIISGYCDVIVLRHKQIGSARIASENSQAPVINGGDGSGEHPTQALVDLYTMWLRLQRLDNLKIAVVGDLLFGRTIHSLLRALALYPGNTAVCVSDPEIALPRDLKSTVEQRGLKIVETDNLAATVKSVDVVYMTRTQANLYQDKCEEELKAAGIDPESEEGKRRIEEQVRAFIARTEGKFVLFPELLPQLDEDESVVWVLHPLPRRGELPTSVDSYPGATYIQQARENAMDVRRALLAMILGI
jgi:aspartate carbamoyltransferase catalytic subunit